MHLIIYGYLKCSIEIIIACFFDIEDSTFYSICLLQLILTNCKYINNINNMPLIFQYFFANIVLVGFQYLYYGSCFTIRICPLWKTGFRMKIMKFENQFIREKKKGFHWINGEWQIYQMDVSFDVSFDSENHIGLITFGIISVPNGYHKRFCVTLCLMYISI